MKKTDRSIKKLLAKKNVLLNEIEELDEEIEGLKKRSPCFEETITVTGYMDLLCCDCNRLIKKDDGSMFPYRCGVYDCSLAGDYQGKIFNRRIQKCLKAEEKSADKNSS